MKTGSGVRGGVFRTFQLEVKPMYNRENTEEADAILARISAELKKQGRKQKELITYLNLPRAAFSGWKAGRGRSFCEHLAAISEFLNVSVEWLVTGSEKKYLVSDRYLLCSLECESNSRVGEFRKRA